MIDRKFLKKLKQVTVVLGGDYRTSVSMHGLGLADMETLKKAGCVMCNFYKQDEEQRDTTILDFITADIKINNVQFTMFSKTDINPDSLDLPF
jgi:hypothetical protein